MNNNKIYKAKIVSIPNYMTDIITKKVKQNRKKYFKEKFGREPQTELEIRFGVSETNIDETKNKIKQIESKSLRKLKYSINSKKLKSIMYNKNK